VVYKAVAILFKYLDENQLGVITGKWWMRCIFGESGVRLVYFFKIET
jgi:hypothetical protein